MDPAFNGADHLFNPFSLGGGNVLCLNSILGTIDSLDQQWPGDNKRDRPTTHTLCSTGVLVSRLLEHFHGKCNSRGPEDVHCWV